MSSSSSTIPSIASNCKASSPVNIPYLPDELLLNCLARVSRLYHSTLFLVSKRFRSLVASKELYKIRKLIGYTESCLYVCLLNEVNPYWFILCRGPTQTPNPNPKPTLASVPSQDYFPTYGWEVIADGSNIYMIGGFNYSKNNPSSKVFIMDCESHTWCEAPSMRVARKTPCASILDGKIYVVGDPKDYDTSCTIECFDRKKWETRKWEDVPNQGEELLYQLMHVFKSLAIDGKLYLIADYDRVLVYKPNEDRWDRVIWPRAILYVMERDPDSFCVIDNVLYGYVSQEGLVWCDFKARFSNVLKGVEGLPKFPKHCYVRLVNYGGKLAVLWEEDVSDFWSAIGSNEKMIWCAEISLERRNEKEIYGKVEWCEIVFKIPKSSCIDKCIAVTV